MMNQAQNQALWRLSLLSIGTILLCILGEWLGDYEIFLIDFPLYSTLETTGSVLMLLLALFVFKFDNNNYTLSRFHYIAVALAAMAIFNLFHAVSNSETYFIWPHGISALVSALILLMVFIPEHCVNRHVYYGLPLLSIVLSTITAFILSSNSNLLPDAATNQLFTDTVLLIYNLSALLYFITAGYFMRRYWQIQQNSDFYFLLISIVHFD
jgi:hypothetical protein